MKKHIIGIPILIILFILFYIDRFILMPLFWMDSLKFREWLAKDGISGFNTQNIINSIFRVLAVTLFYGVYLILF